MLAYGRCMRITHLGHACLLVEVADQRILLDPGTWASGWEGLADISAVLVTHQHPDHVDVDRLPLLLDRNGAVQIHCDHETAAILRTLGIEATAHDGTPRAVGEVTVHPVGALHAVIHEDLPRVANTGVVIRAAGEPSLYHSGDALDGEPGDVDVVSFPLSAPWQASKEMVAFLRRMAVATAIPVHDGTLSANGRTLYLDQADRLGCRDTTRLLDLAGKGPTDISP